MQRKDKQLLEEVYASMYLKESYLNKLKQLNPGWNPEKAKADFSDVYDPEDPEDIEAHVDYEENAAEWLDSISNFTPGVKVGDWIKVKVHGGGGVKSGWALGKIESETTVQGRDYGDSGYKGPSILPAWSIRVYVPVSMDDFLDKFPGDYVLDTTEKNNPKVYSSRGHLNYVQHDEIQSNTGVETYKTFAKSDTFTKLPAGKILKEYSFE